MPFQGAHSVKCWLKETSNFDPAYLVGSCTNVWKCQNQQTTFYNFRYCFCMSLLHSQGSTLHLIYFKGKHTSDKTVIFIVLNNCLLNSLNTTCCFVLFLWKLINSCYTFRFSTKPFQNLLLYPPLIISQYEHVALIISMLMEAILSEMSVIFTRLYCITFQTTAILKFIENCFLISLFSILISALPKCQSMNELLAAIYTSWYPAEQATEHYILYLITEYITLTFIKWE